jgi:hypothetical protein
LLALTEVSIVAVHGLGAHPDDTWTKRRGPTEDDIWVNWLHEKDMLPATVSQARIMRYGYKSDWVGPEAIKQSVRAVSPRLLAALHRQRTVRRIDIVKDGRRSELILE